MKTRITTIIKGIESPEKNTVVDIVGNKSTVDRIVRETLEKIIHTLDVRLDKTGTKGKYIMIMEELDFFNTNAGEFKFEPIKIGEIIIEELK